VVGCYVRDNRASRLIRRLTIANRWLTDTAHISTPKRQSSGANGRYFGNNVTSPQPKVD
jgi:hypothetical protein